MAAKQKNTEQQESGMRILVGPADLAKALDVVKRAVAAKAYVPILKHVKMEAIKGDGLYLTGTDLEVALRIAVDGVMVEESGELTVGFSRFEKAVKSLAALDDVELVEDTDKDELVMNAPGTSLTFKTLPVGDFPPFETDDTWTLEIPADTLTTLIKKVSYAVATDESRPIYCGVLFDLKDSVLTMAGTDGFRLAVASKEIDSDGSEWQLIVHKPAMDMLVELLKSDPEQMVTVSTLVREEKSVLGKDQPNTTIAHIGFTGKGFRLNSQLIEGQYANTHRIIENAKAVGVDANDNEITPTTIRVLTDNAKTGLRIMAVYTPLNSPLIVIKAGVEACEGNEGMDWYATDPEFGEGKHQVAGKCEGPDVEFGLNRVYFYDAIDAVGSEAVIIRHKQAGEPLLFFPGKANGVEETHLVMPMQGKH